jgi:hypothetical protein
MAQTESGLAFVDHGVGVCYAPERYRCFGRGGRSCVPDEDDGDAQADRTVLTPAL